MWSNKYKEIKRTELEINDRLLNFISEKKEIEDILNEIDIESNNFNIDINKPPIDNWISSDYIKLNGNTYIDEFLDLYSHTLNPLEIEILNQKLLSNISMFEILKIDGSRLYIEDTFDAKSYSVIDDGVGSVLIEGDYILARIAKVRGEYIFFGDVEYVPSSIKHIFLENLLIYFNRERITQPELELKEFLKRFSLEVYSIYRDCLIYHMDETEEDIPAIISDITEFQEYALDNFPSSYHILMTNLMEIFEYGLMDKGLSLQDLNKINFSDFFREAIRDGFIKSKEEYNSYLETLKIYLKFLGPSNPEYKETYNHIVEISNNRFKYMSGLKDANFDYEYDKALVSAISSKLNTNSLTLVGDLDRFLIYILEFKLDLTPKRKEIRKKELLSLNKILKSSSPIINSRPSQSDSLVINLFYHLSLDYGLTRILDSKMLITEKGKNYFKLRDEEKYAIILSYIFSLTKSNPLKICDREIESFLSLEYKDFTELLNKIKDNEPLLDNILVKYLDLLGIVEFDKYNDFIVSSLGKVLYKYMQIIKDKQRKVISIESYRERKTKEV